MRSARASRGAPAAAAPTEPASPPSRAGGRGRPSRSRSGSRARASEPSDDESDDMRDVTPSSRRRRSSNGALPSPAAATPSSAGAGSRRPSAPRAQTGAEAEAEAEVATRKRARAPDAERAPSSIAQLTTRTHASPAPTAAAAVAAARSAFATAATPLTRRSAPKAKLAPITAPAASTRCPECQTPLNTRGRCANAHCAPSSSAQGAATGAGAGGSASRPKKSIPKPRCRQIACSGLLDAGKCTNPVCVSHLTGAGVSVGAAGLGVRSSPRERAGRVDYHDPFQSLYDDEERDPSFGGKRGRAVPAAVAASPARPAPVPRVAPASAPAPSTAAAVAAPVSSPLPSRPPTPTEPLEWRLSRPESMYEELLQDDPRHSQTLATGTYLVHPEAKMPEGFRQPPRESEEKKEHNEEMVIGDATGAAAAAASPPLPVLLRCGFTSSYPSEPVRSIHSRYDSFVSVWSTLRRTLLSELRGQEEALFDGVLRFAQEVFTDRGVAQGDASAQLVATNIVHTSAVIAHEDGGSQLLPLRTHALPVALVHAGLNLEDHPLLMAGLSARVAAREARRKERFTQRRRARRGAATKGKESTPSKGSSSRHAESSDEGEEDEGEQSPEAHSGDAAAAASSNDSFPTPSPFVATLPAQPQSLLALFQSLFVSLLDTYPSPRSGVTPVSASALLHKSKPGASGAHERGSVEWIIESLCAWMGEHRAEQRARYYQWRRMQEKKERQSAGTEASPMELDGEEEAKVDADADANMEEDVERKSADGRKRFKMSHASPAAPSTDVPPLPPTVECPSFIYPRVLLLLPSFDRFPPAILTDFLLLLLEHPRLRLFDTCFPVVLVWPLGGGTRAVHSLLPRIVLDRVWFGVFEADQPAALMDGLVSRVFQARDGRLRTPLALGTHPMQFLLRQFYDSHTSIHAVLKAVEGALLDKCDAGGADYTERDGEQEGETGSNGNAARPVADEFERGCPLSATYMRAWMRQRKSEVRLRSATTSATPHLGALLQERADPLDRWVSALSMVELQQLAALPSVQRLSTPPPIPQTAATAGSFRARIPAWLLQLDAHRLTQWRATNVFFLLGQLVGFFPAAASQQQQEQGLTPERELWMHVLSFPIFTLADKSASGAAPVLQLHPSSRRRFSRASTSSGGSNSSTALDALLTRHATEHPIALRDLLLTEMKRHEAAMAAQLAVAQRAEQSGRVEGNRAGATVRALEAALANWREQLVAVQASMHEATAAPTAAPAPAARAAPSSANRRTQLMAVSGITSAMSRGKESASGVLHAIMSFCSTLLAPLRALPLAELCCYERRHALRVMFDSQPEATIFRALTQSDAYLAEGIDLRMPANLRVAAAARAAAASSSGAPSSLLSPSASTAGSASSGSWSRSHELPDLCVAFDIFSRTNGPLVNVRDWFDAFKATMRGGQQQAQGAERGDGSDEGPLANGAATKKRGKTAKRAAVRRSNPSVGDEDAADGSSASAAGAGGLPDPLSDLSLQARFISSLSTLTRMLGYCQKTQRRIDHVVKLSMLRPY